MHKIKAKGEREPTGKSAPKAKSNPRHPQGGTGKKPGAKMGKKA
jgi:hypothetical protein